MSKDPYISLLDAMNSGKGAQISVIVGEVLAVSPILVRANGLELDKDDLLVNDMLLSGYERSTSGGTTTWTNRGFAVGDLVLLIPSADMQQFYLVCRLKAVT